MIYIPTRQHLLELRSAVPLDKASALQATTVHFPKSVTLLGPLASLVGNNARIPSDKSQNSAIAQPVPILGQVGAQTGFTVCLP